MGILATIILTVIFVSGVLIYNALSWGYVISVFYGWFILPLYPHLPHFSVLQFISILLFIKALNPTTGSFLKEEYYDKSKIWFSMILAPWLTLFFGWVAKMFL
jgi:hypothetical protein